KQGITGRLAAQLPSNAPFGPPKERGRPTLGQQEATQASAAPPAPEYDGARHFVEGLRRLAERYGPHLVRVEAGIVPRPETPPAQIDRILNNLEKDIQDEIAAGGQRKNHLRGARGGRSGGARSGG